MLVWRCEHKSSRRSRINAGNRSENLSRFRMDKMLYCIVEMVEPLEVLSEPTMVGAFCTPQSYTNVRIIATLSQGDRKLRRNHPKPALLTEFIHGDKEDVTFKPISGC